ncbi:MAG: nuclear transport factor 2 family protein [Acidimicrobiales bacterium]
MPKPIDAVERLIATEDIRQLAFRYADAVDRRDLDQLVALYRPDARFGPHGEGPAAAKAFFRESLSTIGMAVLLVANHLIDFEDADNATGTVWAHGFIDDHREGFIQQLIKYDDRYVRVDGRWCFTRRRHSLWLGWKHDEAAPLAQPAAEWPARQVGLGSMPYDDPAWQEFWSDRGGPMTASE